MYDINKSQKKELPATRFQSPEGISSHTINISSIVENVNQDILSINYSIQKNIDILVVKSIINILYKENYIAKSDYKKMLSSLKTHPNIFQQISI